MSETFFASVRGIGELVLRLSLAAVFFRHGWMKLFPPGATPGPGGFASWLGQLGVPAPLMAAWMVALLETLGSVLLVVGIGTRIVALGLVVNMVVAMYLVKIGMAHAPFISTQQTQGWEFEFALAALALALFFTGAGRFSIDHYWGM